jgi:hypothetical protein
MAMLQETVANEDPSIAEHLQELGLFNAQGSRLEYAAGSADGALFQSVRLVNGKPWLGRFLGAESFTHEHFGIVPRDATLVTATTFDLNWIIEIIRQIEEETGREIINQVREAFGIDLEAGVIGNLGPRWIYYTAESTGGGGVLSSVLIGELKDPEAFLQAQSAALANANQLGATLGRGYARTREWQAAGQQAFTAVFPGLPIPLELSWAVAGKRLVVALSPVGLLGALAQLESDSSVLQNELFSQSVLEPWPEGEVFYAGFIDTARFANRGYGGANLAASALANAVRLPFDDVAEPGLLIPPYAIFAEGIRPTGFIGWWNGDDLLIKGHADGSVLVQIAAYVGQTGGLNAAFTPAMSLGALLPALGEARKNAQSLKATSNVRAVASAAVLWSQDNPQQPLTLDQLIQNVGLMPEQLDSPVADAWDGHGDIGLRVTYPEGQGLHTGNPQLVVVIDRAAYLTGHDTISLGFADGHVEVLDFWGVEGYLDMEINQGAREDFKINEE